jgi:hypothetical protein
MTNKIKGGHLMVNQTSEWVKGKNLEILKILYRSYSPGNNGNPKRSLRIMEFNCISPDQNQLV